ncbi:glycosyltransferase 87 family protein [Pseudobutyrivibrio sp.]|uniref:glycosyltransferase 87 family protein n=1 Tax=Pseudobutyrivibrio sp. TaxID=2014367 RepID=UPI0025FD2258|nr:glycosyltransferase 87 family protein [Pseudobutyrivibrio sp.]MBR5648360.1 hypothetical protein [Pseudobutyrivibrio sp.]
MNIGNINKGKISKAETTVLEFAHKNITYIFLGFIILLSILIRYSFRDSMNTDLNDYLAWYDGIKANGGIFGGLSGDIYNSRGELCNYPFPFLFIVSIMTSLPINPLHAFKITSCLVDYLNAITISILVMHFYKEKENGFDKKTIQLMVLAFCIVVMHPIVFLNSAMWGQCDGLYVLWVLLSLVLLIKEKYFWTFVFFGVGLSFKLQAILVLPFLLFYYFYKKRFSIFYFAFTPVTILIMNIPAFLQGRTIKEVLGVYVSNVGLFDTISMRYPSFWLVICGVLTGEDYILVKNATILITICVLAFTMYLWIIRNVEFNVASITFMAFLLIYAAVLFLPEMHDRYGYIYEMLAIAVLLMDKKTIIPFFFLSFISFRTYGRYLFGLELDYFWLSMINVLTFISYYIILNKNIMNISLKKEIEE